ncbi:glycoside hydrolase family 43 protein [Gryllotalpicola koreensis]|uniref:Glycoside hydrolase family 43 protein n=1 Tax=Gryllotalpicola koreensis TaxID=993086 RepID=A0ABP8ACU9_9MICO
MSENSFLPDTAAPVPLNPVVAGFYPDPSVCRAEGRYYLANSTFEYFPGLPVQVSDDLVSWTPIGHAVSAADAVDFGSIEDSKGLYAPTIRYHEGTFYIVCTLVGDGPDSGFIVTATDPAGPWSRPVWVHGADGFDPSLLFHEGRAYWCATRIVQPGDYPGQCEVWVREIDVATGELLGAETVIWQSALRDATWSEAPHIFERNGWFYLLTAEGGTFRDHAIVIARSRSLTGPYENCPRNPIFTHRHLGGEYPVQNVGHADFVERSDGSWAAVLLAVRTIDEQHILGRETFLAEVVWEEDWPVVNPGRGAIADVGDRPLTEIVDPAVIGDALAVRGPVDFAHETGEGILLRSTGETVVGGGHPAALLYRLRHHDAEVAVTFGRIDADAVAGVLLRQSSRFSIRLELANGRARVIRRQSGLDEIADEWLADGRDHHVIAQFSGSSVSFVVDGRVSAPVATDVLSTEVAGGFVGTVWGPYVEGHAGTATAFVRSLTYMA